MLSSLIAIIDDAIIINRFLLVFFFFNFLGIGLQPGMVTTDLLMSGATTKQVRIKDHLLLESVFCGL